MSTARVRIAFMGTPEWSVGILDKLHQYSPVCLVYTQPPQAQKRGMRMRETPVHAWALRHNIDIQTPTTLRSTQAQEVFQSYQIDWVVVAAYGLILPPYTLHIPYGATNVHASLLPRWRGAAPLQRALLAGDTQTGVSIMQMDSGLDTGPVWSTISIPVGSQTTLRDLHDATSLKGGALLIKTAPHILSGHGKPRPQPTDGITYAQKVQKEEGCLHFTAETAHALERRIRALNGWPGTFFHYRGQRYKVHEACVVSEHGEPGEHSVTDTHWHVGCRGNTMLSLSMVQKSGGRPMPIEAFLRGVGRGISL